MVSLLATTDSLAEIQPQESPRSVFAKGRQSHPKGHMSIASRANMLAMEPTVIAPCNVLESAMARSSMGMHLPTVGLVGRQQPAHSLAFLEHLVAIQPTALQRNASAWALTHLLAHLSSEQLVRILAMDHSVIALLQERAAAMVR